MTDYEATLGAMRIALRRLTWAFVAAFVALAVAAGLLYVGIVNESDHRLDADDRERVHRCEEDNQRWAKLGEAIDLLDPLVRSDEARRIVDELHEAAEPADCSG